MVPSLDVVVFMRAPRLAAACGAVHQACPSVPIGSIGFRPSSVDPAPNAGSSCGADDEAPGRESAPGLEVVRLVFQPPAFNRRLLAAVALQQVHRVDGHCVATDGVVVVVHDGPPHCSQPRGIGV